MEKNKRLMVRISEAEEKLIRKTAAEAGMGVSEFVRLCVAAETARKTMDPVALDALADTFRDGVQRWVRSQVEHEVAKVKTRQKKAG